MPRPECCNIEMRSIHQSCYEGSYTNFYTVIYWCTICGSYKEFENSIIKKERKPSNVST